MTIEVGTELLQCLVRTQKLISELSEGVSLRYGWIAIGSEREKLSREEADGIVQSLEAAGFVLTKSESNGYTTERRFNHVDLPKHLHVDLQHRSTEEEKLQQLLKEQEESLKRIEELKASLRKGADSERSAV